MYVCPDCNTLVGGFADGITTFDASDQQACWDAIKTGCGSDVPPPTPVKTCIDIGDPLYFDDCSWTVSYDPKVEAWISFHDWHPELCLSSINHFLTTKTGITDDPQCPPNFVYNSVTGNCERLIDETVNAVVSVDELPSTAGGCPEGFTFNPATNLCENITTFPVNCGDQVPVIAANDNGAFGKFGARFYEDVISTTSPNLPIANFGSTSVWELQYSNGTTYEWNNFQGPPSTVPVNPYFNTLWKERLNVAGVWTGLTGPSPCEEPPCQEWIGFTQCIEIPTTGVYCVGMAADNRCKFSIDGQLMVSMTSDSTRNFNHWHVVPIALNAGINIITLEGWNSGDVAAFAAEIYDATPFELANMTTVAELEPVIVFSTKNNIDNGFFQVGTTVGCNCPDGGVLSNCAGELQCIEVETAPFVLGCDCPAGYTLVYWNEAEQNFTSPTGDCIDDEIPPICRKVECNCPPGPYPDAIVTQSGTCDNVYLAGPNGQIFPVQYNNLTPAICNFNLLQEEPANFKIGGIWRHNYRCDLFANYYGVDYPWEVELIESTGQNVFTVRSLEYQLESYVYKGDLFNGCSDDRWHDLDFNFDESIIYNTEQVSGLLKLNLDPVGNPLAGLTYPIINSNDIDILYSKVEQKYRFNQFWDVTNDRGEFTNAEQEILMTQCNGYIRDLNSANLNYNKAQGQRKKFRHYYNKIILRRVLSNNRKMLLKLNNTKLNLSYR